MKGQIRQSFLKYNSTLERNIYMHIYSLSLYYLEQE